MEKIGARHPALQARGHADVLSGQWPVGGRWRGQRRARGVVGQAGKWPVIGRSRAASVLRPNVSAPAFGNRPLSADIGRRRLAFNAPRSNSSAYCSVLSATPPPARRRCCGDPSTRPSALVRQPRWATLKAVRGAGLDDDLAVLRGGPAPCTHYQPDREGQFGDQGYEVGHGDDRRLIAGQERKSAPRQIDQA